jgi:hypothetical protein
MKPPNAFMAPTVPGCTKPVPTPETSSFRNLVATLGLVSSSIRMAKSRVASSFSTGTQLTS